MLIHQIVVCGYHYSEINDWEAARDDLGTKNAAEVWLHNEYGDNKHPLKSVVTKAKTLANYLNNIISSYPDVNMYDIQELGLYFKYCFNLAQKPSKKEMKELVTKARLFISNVF